MLIYKSYRLEAQASLNEAKQMFRVCERFSSFNGAFIYLTTRGDTGVDFIGSGVGEDPSQPDEVASPRVLATLTPKRECTPVLSPQTPRHISSPQTPAKHAGTYSEGLPSHDSHSPLTINLSPVVTVIHRVYFCHYLDARASTKV